VTFRLYSELASWWPIFSAPEDYAEEASIYVATLHANKRRDLRHVLELGSGGGNNASHMKTHFDMTLVDLSPAMIEVSRDLNPELEHVEGDMRTVRLERTFDAVMIHDAIAYMLTEDDLAAAITTAATHLEPSGIALFVPDDTVETYRPVTDHGGDDGDGRAIRYLQWAHAAKGSTYETTFVYVLREGDDVRIEGETHTFGLFHRATWLRLIEAAGLEARTVPYEHSTFESPRELFVGLKS
jgi:SAM-dependent methyltransferase